MKIKKIELCGFKSFSDKTELEFPRGVTAVVGPNGCGKSNISDAIRWALGEQSPKQMRGKCMEDVIFSGSESRKPLGMAEVTLTFSNENGRTLPEYMDFSEIAVSRRLFRSGESEYAINNVACRLKDITDLFLGTGVGHRAYSIVEQGKMDFVLNAKPEERRVLIEEAAGITRYKDRKAAALRKMEATQQNLLRLTDVIGEIKRQINSLNRQARKAERFKGLREEVRSLELGQSAQICRELAKRQAEMRIEQQKVQDSEVQAVAEVRETEAAVERMKINLLELQREVASAQDRLLEIEGAIRTRESKVEMALKERESLRGQIQRAQEEIASRQGQRELTAREIRGLEEEGQILDGRLAADGLALAEKEEALQKARARLEEAEGALAGEKNAQVERITRLVHLQNRLVDLDRRAGELSLRRERVAREGEEAELKLQETRALLVHRTQGLEERRTVRRQIQEERESKGAEEKELQGALAELQKVLGGCRERLHQEGSRLSSLLELQKNFEGYQEGVRAILLRRSEEEGRNGFYRLVEDILETDPKYEAVVEAALGEQLQHILVKSQEEGLEGVDYLKAQEAGRSSFIPLHLKDGPPPLSTAPVGGAVPLEEVVRIREEFSHLRSYLLGDIWVVPDLRRAVELWNQNSLWKTLVTLDGEVVHPSGVITGGSREQMGSGTFRRKREIRALTQSTAVLREEVASLERSQEQLIQSLRSLESSLGGLAQALHREDLEIVREEKERDQLELELRRWGERIEVFKFEESQLGGEQVELGERRRETEGTLGAAEREKEEKDRILKAQEEDLRLLKTRIEGQGAEVTEAKVKLVAGQERRQNLRRDLERARQALGEAEALLARRQEEVQKSQELIIAAEEGKREAEAELGGLLARQQELKGGLEERKEALRAEQEKLDRAEGEWKGRREALQDLREQKNALSLKQMELEMNLKHLFAQAEEKYRLGPEEILSREDERDYFSPEVNGRLQELKGQIEAMGEVNLLAIQEYEESKKRLEFLTEQESDLVQSLEALDQAIKKINRTSRRRFSETFQAVNQKFQEIFSTLFSGGQAELVLMDESNILESGVDIVVRPPGKRLQNVNLLSGGEKALTAAALIFSLFLINPSPFCLLDEVDAPLDDANIGRFNQLITHLARNTQIIMVTHNKQTMELADTLYGVTMEEPGVSRLVSVKLN